VSRQLNLDVEQDEAPCTRTWPVHEGELAERIRSHEWAATPLGPLENWSVRLRTLVELMLDSPEPTCLLWGRSAIHLYNDAYIPLLHVRHPHALGRPFEQVWLESVLQTGRPLVICNRSYHVSVTPVRAADDRETEAVLVRLFDITERVELTLADPLRDESARLRAQVRAEARLRDIERQQRALIEGLPQFIWRASGDGQWSWCAPQWSRYTGLAETESRGHQWMLAVHPEDRAKVRSAWRDAVQRGEFDLEYRIGPLGEHRYRWFQSRATPIRNEEHDIVEWVGTSTDVDELREARERQKLLVAELQHRTRNLIGVVKSIARQTLRENDSLGAFTHQFDDRLGALSRVQGLLSRAEHEPITLEALIGMELEALGSSSVRERVHAYGPTVHLQPSIVQTFALAIHELMTNALKYGSLLTPEGRLYVTWDLRQDAEAQPRLHLEWMESGPPRDEPRGTGYGRELIEQMLPYVLEARTSYQITPKGVYCTVDAPLSMSHDTGVPRIAAAR
jgi:PAS domain S-box-containing protein